jgi:hypothetical protein
MESRKKAQDVFNDTKFTLSNKTTFEKAFPDIEKISIEVNEKGKGIKGELGRSLYGKSSISEYINCKNTKCFNGGFRIGEVIRSLYFNRETEAKGNCVCQGREGTPKGRRLYDFCENRFNFNVKIEYKPKNETTPFENNQ